MQCINHVWEGRGRPSYVQTVKINTQTNSVILYYSIKNIDISEKYIDILQDVTTGGENKISNRCFLHFFILIFVEKLYQCLSVRRIPSVKISTKYFKKLISFFGCS